MSKPQSNIASTSPGKRSAPAKRISTPPRSTAWPKTDTGSAPANSRAPLTQ
jgi:hypothetical protein